MPERDGARASARGGGAPRDKKKMAGRSIRVIDARDARSLERLIHRDAVADRAFERRVRAIVDRVRASGHRALLGFAKRFDGVRPPLEVTPDEMRAAARQVDPAVRRAIHRAAENIARVAFRQIPRHWDLDVLPGVSVEQRVEPIARAGCYVPGGRFPLPSSLLMTVVPARVAGVRETVVVCPRPDAAIMTAALEAGVTRLFRIGGAHAVAALADKVARAVASQQTGRAIAERSLSANGAIVVTRSDRDAIELANRLAPEHLVVDREALIRRPIVAGAVFVGPYSAQAAGDYASGSNHVLPTAGAARWRGGLSAADFVRVMSVQRITRDGLARLAPIILPLARAEGLTAHAESVEVRLK